MADGPRRYGIMLWGMIDNAPTDWPIVRRSDSLQELRDLDQYDGTMQYVVARRDYTAILLENKELLLAPTGRTYRGGIFELKEKQES